MEHFFIKQGVKILIGAIVVIGLLAVAYIFKLMVKRGACPGCGRSITYNAKFTEIKCPHCEARVRISSDGLAL